MCNNGPFMLPRRNIDDVYLQAFEFSMVVVYSYKILTDDVLPKKKLKISLETWNIFTNKTEEKNCLPASRMIASQDNSTRAKRNEIFFLRVY